LSGQGASSVPSNWSRRREQGWHAPDQYQSTLRLIHYMSMEGAKPEDFSSWRAGAHSDLDCLTILHQKEGEGGLQVCPGKDAALKEW
ncbi:2OG-Fe(II) oxygenase family protein, partial [Rhizobium ruizarguesonis]